jgi:hypothetical protein
MGARRERMNGGATVSPLALPNLCFCGHDYLAHTPGAPGNCALCQDGVPSGNNHDFVSCNEIWPRVGFYQHAPRGFVAAGGAYPGGSPNPQSIVSSAGNPAGGTTILFPTLNTLSPPAVPGMCITSSVSGLQNQQTYKIIAVNNVTNTVTVERPLAASLGSQRCFFYATDDGNMGPARPPNGQRAG